QPLPQLRAQRVRLSPRDDALSQLQTSCATLPLGKFSWRFSLHRDRVWSSDRAYIHKRLTGSLGNMAKRNRASGHFSRQNHAVRATKPHRGIPPTDLVGALTFSLVFGETLVLSGACSRPAESCKEQRTRIDRVEEIRSEDTSEPGLQQDPIGAEEKKHSLPCRMTGTATQIPLEQPSFALSELQGLHAARAFLDDGSGFFVTYRNTYEAWLSLWVSTESMTFKLMWLERLSEQDHQVEHYATTSGTITFAALSFHNRTKQIKVYDISLRENTVQRWHCETPPIVLNSITRTKLPEMPNASFVARPYH